MQEAKTTSRNKNKLVEATIHENWIKLINYCDTTLRNGILCFKTRNSAPTKILKPPTKEKIVLDAEAIEALFVKEDQDHNITVKITRKWKGLIDITAQSFPFGQVCVRLRKGEPTEVIEDHTKADISLDHPETFPNVPRLWPQSNKKY